MRFDCDREASHAGSVLQFGGHRDVCTERYRDHAGGFGANGRVDEFGLRDTGKLGHDIQIDLHDHPADGQLLKGQSRRGDNPAFRETHRLKFVGKRQGKAARLRGSDQFRRVGLQVALKWNARGDTSLLQDAAFSAHRAGTARGLALPVDRRLSNNLIQDLIIRSEAEMDQYFVSWDAMLLRYEENTPLRCAVSCCGMR